MGCSASPECWRCPLNHSHKPDLRSFAACAGRAGAAATAAHRRAGARYGTSGHGDASIAGVVTTDETVARPLRRVVLTLNGGGLRQGRVAVSDDEGRFSFGDLPPGRFNLSGARPGYVTSY